MTAKKTPLSRVRFISRPSSILVKCAALSLVALCIVALLALRGNILDTQQQTEILRAQAAALERENRNLEQYIAELNTVQGITRIAQEELGLADPNTIVFTPEQ